MTELLHPPIEQEWKRPPPAEVKVVIRPDPLRRGVQVVVENTKPPPEKNEFETTPAEEQNLFALKLVFTAAMLAHPHAVAGTLINPFIEAGLENALKSGDVKVKDLLEDGTQNIVSGQLLQIALANLK